jgi:ATP-dependent DNA helicase RecQ
MDNSVSSSGPSWDGTLAARKALMATQLTNQRFGMVHLIDVLVGKKAPTVLRHAHDRLRVFGSGTDISRKVWETVFRQLLSQGFLRYEATGFGALRCTEHAVSVLKGEEKVIFPGEGQSIRQARAIIRPLPSRYDPKREQLFQALRERRSALARANKLSDKDILSDAALAEVIRQRPRNKAELVRIPGVGDMRARRFGDEILEVLYTFPDRQRTIEMTR